MLSYNTSNYHKLYGDTMKNIKTSSYDIKNIKISQSVGLCRTNLNKKIRLEAREINYTIQILVEK